MDGSNNRMHNGTEGGSIRALEVAATGIFNPPRSFSDPVGSVWIGLTEPTYGIHGTPEPEKVDKEPSHGCVRLTNWDAEELAKLVRPGVPVSFVQ